MQFSITFKTPDVLLQLETNLINNGETDENIQKALDLANAFIKYGESTTLYFDTDTKTVEVLPVRKLS